MSNGRDMIIILIAGLIKRILNEFHFIHVD